ncbi:MAG: DUF3006 domain-containing protein [Nitrososphaera sp.]
MAASLDRFEGEFAVIHADIDGKKFDFPRKKLPRNARPGARLLIQLDGDRVTGVTVDERATENAKERIKRKYHTLRQRKYPKR